MYILFRRCFTVAEAKKKWKFLLDTFRRHEKVIVAKWLSSSEDIKVGLL